MIIMIETARKNKLLENGDNCMCLKYHYQHVIKRKALIYWMVLLNPYQQDALNADNIIFSFYFLLCLSSKTDVTPKTTSNNNNNICTYYKNNAMPDDDND